MFHDKDQEEEQPDARAEKYATDLAAEEDCCTFKTARCHDWWRSPRVLEAKSIVVPSKPDAGSIALQKVLSKNQFLAE